MKKPINLHRRTAPRARVVKPLKARQGRRACLLFGKGGARTIHQECPPVANRPHFASQPQPSILPPLGASQPVRANRANRTRAPCETSDSELMTCMTYCAHSKHPVVVRRRSHHLNIWEVLGGEAKDVVRCV